MPDADFSEVRNLATDLAKAGPVMAARAQTVIVKTAFDIEGTAKSLAPVDTGALRNSIGSDIRPLNAIIPASASYAGFLEWGTSRMAPQPYMGPRVARGGQLGRHAARFLSAMEQVLVRTLDG